MGISGIDGAITITLADDIIINFYRNAMMFVHMHV